MGSVSRRIRNNVARKKLLAKKRDPRRYRVRAARVPKTFVETRPDGSAFVTTKKVKAYRIRRRGPKRRHRNLTPLELLAYRGLV